jgi:hypothetical protein
MSLNGRCLEPPWPPFFLDFPTMDGYDPLLGADRHYTNVIFSIRRLDERTV